MKKTLLIPAIMAGVGTITAGAAIGMYVHEHSTNKDKQTEWYMNHIVNQINKIPGIDKTHDILTVKAFEEDIKKRTAEIHGVSKTMQEATINILEEKLKKSHDAAIKGIAAAGNNHKLLEDEVTTMQTNLKSELEQIKSGIIGEHDLSYYKTLLDSSVRTSQFNLLTTDVNHFKTNTDTEINEIKTDLTKSEKNIADIKTVILQLTDTSNGKIKALSDGLKQVTTDLSTLTATTQTGFASLKNEVTTTTNDLKALIDGAQAESSTNSNEILGIQKNLVNITAKLKDNSFSIVELTGMYNDVLENSSKIDLKYAELVNVIDRVKSATEANATAATTNANAIKQLETSSTNMNNKLNDMKTTMNTVAGNYNALKTRVENNEKDIADLFSKLKNTTVATQTKLTAIDTQMIGIDGSIAAIWGASDALKKDFHENISLNEAAMTKLKASLVGLQTTTDGSQKAIAVIQDELKTYAKGVQQVRDIIAIVMTDVDLLTDRVTDNEAKIYGLEQRISALENSNGGDNSKLFYAASNATNSSGYNMAWNFKFSESLKNFRAIQIDYRDAFSGRVHTTTIGISPVSTGTTYINGGDRSHPNRSWYGLKISYRYNTMQTSYFQAAGNASWHWHSNRYAMVAKVIRGIYK